MTTPGPAVILIGNGGHAKVILGILRLNGARIVGVVGPAGSGGIGGWPLLGEDDDLPELRGRASGAFVAVGDNDRRERLFDLVENLGFEFVNAIHPAAVIDGSVRVGRGVAIVAGAVVNADTEIGDNVIVNTAATIDHDCWIGRGAHVGPGSHLSGYVRVGPRALIGIGATVGRGRGLTVGEGAVVGAGSVVIEDVADGAVVWGVPAAHRPRQGDSEQSGG